jgi:hypothetical protein
MTARTTVEDLAMLMEDAYASSDDDMERFFALQKLWVDRILPEYPMDQGAAHETWTAAARLVKGSPA